MRTGIMKKKNQNEFSDIARKRDKLIWAGILTVLIVAMSYTSFGFLGTEYVSITFLPILVVIGAIHAGPVCGLYLGTVFGITSFAHCFSDYEFGHELLSYSMVGTAILCILPRAMMGLSCGGIYRLFSRNCRPVFAKLVSSFSGAFLNTVFFIVSLIVIFGNSDYIMTYGSNPTAVMRTLITSNAFIEWIFCAIAGLLTPRIKFVNPPNDTERGNNTADSDSVITSSEH